MDITHPDLHPLYADHLATLKSRTDTALARAGRDHLVLAAGTPRYEFLDTRGRKLDVMLLGECPRVLRIPRRHADESSAAGVRDRLGVEIGDHADPDDAET